MAERRRISRRAIACAAGAAFVVGGTAFALGPGAPWIIDHFADGQRVWRLGQVRVDGVSGNWLGGLRAAQVTLGDDDGVWLEAENVALDWRPQALLGGGVWINGAHADVIRVLRQPALAAARPSAAGFDVRIDALRIGALDLAEPVLGAAARFGVDLQLDFRDDALGALDFTLRRSDSDADNAVVLYHAGGAYALLVNVAGAPGGVISRLLGVPEQGVRIQAVGDGDLQTGGARYEADIGDAELLRGETRWTPTGWRTHGEAQLDLLPGLQATARRIGARVTLDASGAHAGAFTARAATPFFAAELRGALSEANELDGPARLIATTQRISDIAREAPFELGAARLEGELRQANGVFAIRAQLDARELDVLGQRATLAGPLEAALAPGQFTLSADLRAPDQAPPLFAQAHLRTSLSYDRRRGRFSLNRTTLEGEAIAIDAQGWVNDGDGEFSGAWRVKNLAALGAELGGSAGGRWRAYAEAHADDPRIWITALDGAGADISGAPEIVPQLLGAAPRIDGLFRYEDGGVSVDHLRVEGRQVHAAAAGRIVRGEANLALEASARGPLSLGAAEIGGAVDATGRLTGPLSRAALTATAQLSSFAASGIVVAQPRVDFTLTPHGGGYQGHAQVRGAVSGQALTAASTIAVARGALSLSDLVTHVGALEARGTASVSARGVAANLALDGAIDGLLSGASGRIAGHVALTPETVALDAQLTSAHLGALRLRTASIDASGPFRAIEARFDLQGALERAPLAFEGIALVSAAESATDVQVQGRGTLAGAAIATRTPLAMHWAQGALEAVLDVSLADGALRGQWRERGRALSGTATLINAPLEPLAAIWGQRASGRVAGEVALANSGDGLTGEADLTLAAARFAGRQRGTLDMHIVGDLGPSRLAAMIDASSTDGLVAHLEADAPVTTSAAPFRIALAHGRRGRATWSVRGPADPLWAATRLQDQALSGQVEGEGALEFGAGSLSGDGQLEIIDGRFEDKLTGITLTDLDALVSLGERGVNIERFTAAGARGGRLTATGGSANPREGAIAVTLDDIWVANRPDARARGSGELNLAWEGLDAAISGHLELEQADLNIAQSAEAGIPSIDVVEINRPGAEDDYGGDEPALLSPRAASTRLDVHVTAPGRVFTRGRGIDAEWSLDLRLAGTAATPRVFGEANTIRGHLALSGQPFDLSRGRIVFNGDPLNARLDIAAERNASDLTARILISGAASDPDITLTSTPALPEDEILPQVLFGRAVEDLSPFEAAQIAAALANLSGRASFDLVDVARAAAGLDRFNVRQDENGGLLVAGGVYLTREVYVEIARTGLGQAASSVEWTVRPQLVMITSFLGNGDQRVSLRWRRESD